MMKKAAVCFLTAILIMLVFTLSAGAFDGNDYGGSSSGGYSSGSYSSYDSDSFFSDGGTTIMPFFAIILLILMAAANLLSKNGKTEQNQETV